MAAGPRSANPEELAIIQQGATAWNNWREKNKERPSFNLSGADLQGRDLTGADLRAVNLENAVLRGAKLGKGTLLWNANLSGADLYQADLRGADLQDVNFSNADLYQANLRESNLQGSDLSTAKGGLLSHQFAGSDLTGAKLPEPLAKLYADLSSAKEISSNAQKLFLALLAGCLYSWLTIAQTTDVELITNRATTPLPIIQAAIPIVGFYVVAPLILLCLYFYFHFYLQKLWEELGSLPAIFTDGRELHQRTDPWLLNDLVRSHFVKLKDGRPFLSYLQSCVSIIVSWWLVPLTLLAIWGRFLPRQTLVWSIFHAVLVTISITAAIGFYFLARRTLHGNQRNALRVGAVFTSSSGYARLVIVVFICILFIAITMGTIYGEQYWPDVPYRADEHYAFDNARERLVLQSPRTWLPFLLTKTGYSPFANLKNADVSTKPLNWTGKSDEEINIVRGANLDYAKLRYVVADGAFFVNAHLSWAEMDHASFTWADLRHTIIIQAKMSHSHLLGALLEGTHLEWTDLELADLQHANLQHANLMGANLTGAWLDFADVKYANFRTLGSETRGLTPGMMMTCSNWQLAFYDPDMLQQLGLPPDHNQKLQKQMDAELKQAKSAATTSPTPR